MSPVISINIPTKDRAHVLGRALESIASQTFRDYEIIIVNDGSTDQTSVVIAEFQSRHPNIVVSVIIHSTPRGVAISRQEALQASSGRYIAIMDDDDEWIDPEKLQVQVAYALAHLDTGLIGTWARMVDQQTKQEWLWQPPTEDAMIRRQMLSRNCFVNPTIIFDRELAIQSGGFDQQFEYADDYAFCILLGTKTKMHIIPQYTVKFFVNAGGMTERHRLQFIRAGLGYCRKYRHHYPGYLRALIKWYIQIAVVVVFGARAWSRLKYAILKPFSRIYERVE